MQPFSKKNYLVYLPNNFLVWSEAFIEYASYEFGALAACLDDETAISFDHLVSHLSPSLFPRSRVSSGSDGGKGAEAKGEASASSLSTITTPERVTAQLVMEWPISHPIIDQAKVTLYKARERLYEKAPRLFALMVSTLSPSSRAIITSSNEDRYKELQLRSDVFGLFQLIKGTHVLNVEAEIYRLETKLRSLSLLTQDYTIYCARFRSLLTGLKNAGSTITQSMVVYVFLNSLKRSPLQPAADRWLENPHQKDYPKTFEGACNLMHLAWINLDQAVVANADLSLEEPAQVMVAKAQHGDQVRTCAFCLRKGHTSEQCFKYKVERVAGDLVIVQKQRSQPQAGPDVDDAGAGKMKKKKGKKKPKQEHSSGLAISASSSLSFLSTGPTHRDDRVVLVFDTGSTIGVMNSLKLFDSVAPCDAHVKGVNGVWTSVSRRGSTRWGDAYYVPECPHNLVSSGCLIDAGYVVTLNDDVYHAKSPSGVVYTFTRVDSGLYECELDSSDVCVAVRHHTAEQKKRAVMVRELHDRLNHPSDDQLCALLDSTCLIDTPLTSKDVRVSASINGPCNSCLVGKFMSPPSRQSTTTPASVPGGLIHADIAFFQEGSGKSRPYIVAVDDFTGMTFCSRLVNKSRECVKEGLLRIVHEFKSWGHPVQVVRSDSENVFRSVKPDLNQVGVQMQFAAPGAHEKRVEIQIRYIRNRFDVVKASLPYNLPSSIYPWLLAHIASTMNMIPNASSAPHAPFTLVTGKKVSFKHDLRVPFGSAVVVNAVESRSSCADQQKGVLGVMVGRDADTLASIRVYLPSTNEIVVRRYMKAASLSKDLIDTLNQRARESRPPGGDERVVVMRGRPINADPLLPQPLVEDTVPDNMGVPTHVHVPIVPVPNASVSPVPVPRDTSRSTPPAPRLIPVCTPPHSRGATAASRGADAGGVVPTPPHVQVGSGPSSAPASDSIVGVQAQAEDPVAAPTIGSSASSGGSDDSHPASDGPVRGSRYPSRIRRTTYKDIGQKNGFVSFLTVKQATKKYPDHVIKAARAEMSQLRERGTIVPVHAAPKGVKVVHSSLMMTPKFGEDGNIRVMKGRLVAAGNEVDPALYGREDKSSPTVSSMSVMALLAFASYERAELGALDFPGAFLLTTLGDHKYMWLGKEATAALIADCPSWKRFVKRNGTMMVRVEGALYGFPESGKRWFDCLSNFLIESGYQQSKVDPCIFFKVGPNGKIIMSLHVDDILYASTDKRLIAELVKKIEDRFGKVKKKEGDVIPFLGMRISRDPSSGEVAVDQPTYVAELVEDIFEEKMVSSPSDRSLLDRLDPGPKLNDVKDYRSRVMKLMYLATKTRPDLLFAVSTLASRCSEPTQSDMRSLNHVFEYLNCHQDYKLNLKCDSMVLSASVDASHDIHRDSRGHSGLVVSIGGVPVFHRSTKQKNVSTSAMQAEIAALFESIPYISWFRDLLTEIGYPQAGPTPVEQDNQSAIMVYEDRGILNTKKTRHLKNKYEYVKEVIDDGVIRPVYVPTASIIADKLTKPFAAAKLNEFFKMEKSEVVKKGGPDTHLKG